MTQGQNRTPRRFDAPVGILPAFIPARLFALPLAAIVLLAAFAGVTWAFEAGDIIEGEGYDAKQERVTLRNDDGRFDVHLYGIDLPEERQSGASAALSALKARVLKKELTAEVLEGDGGDLLALVEGPRGSVNAGLVEEGHAWVSPSCLRDFCEEWRALESEARERRLGLWANVNAIPPWEYREAREAAAQRKLDTPGFTRIDEQTLKGQRKLYGGQGKGGTGKLQRIEKMGNKPQTKVSKKSSARGEEKSPEDRDAREARDHDADMERLDRLIEESRAGR